ncbi:hypothetical protein KAR48_12555 [bacterium]|nr:hypothetical protein [bacterium]
MNLWDKVKTGLEEGLQTLSDKTTEMSKLGKMKWERRNIQKEIHREFISIGKVVHELSTSNNEEQLVPGISDEIEKLDELESRLKNKEQEIEDFTAKIDNTQVKGLKKDLELGDGTIEQIVVTENSPMVGKKLMEIKLPKAVLVGTIVRDGHVIIPDGKTILKADDKVTLLGEKENVDITIKKLCRE